MDGAVIPPLLALAGLSITYLAHGLKKLLDKCNVLGEELRHAAAGHKVRLFSHELPLLPKGR